MRSIFTILFSLIIYGAFAQTHLPAGGPGFGFSPWQPVTSLPSFNVDATKNNWQLKPFASLSAGYMYFGGGGVSYLSAPVGVALFRPLNANWTAYGAATVTPAFYNVNNFSTIPAGANYHGYPYQSGYGMSVTPGIQGGLIYTNDAKTFSISGHLSVEKTNYPVYPMEQRNPSKHY
jgi:hypothetical protein